MGDSAKDKHVLDHLRLAEARFRALNDVVDPDNISRLLCRTFAIKEARPGTRFGEETNSLTSILRDFGPSSMIASLGTERCLLCAYEYLADKLEEAVAYSEERHVGPENLISVLNSREARISKGGGQKDARRQKKESQLIINISSPDIVSEAALNRARQRIHSILKNAPPLYFKEAPPVLAALPVKPPPFTINIKSDDSNGVLSVARAVLDGFRAATGPLQQYSRELRQCANQIQAFADCLKTV